MTTTHQSASDLIDKPRADSRLVATRAFAEVFRAYLECSDEVQEAIREMVEILNDSGATFDEREAALLTISEALFPSHHNGFGEDLEESEEKAPDGVRVELEQADADQDTFAERVNALLAERGMTQDDLGRLVGVGQPAVSMLLSRACRPQRRTVDRLARALKVDPSDLWPVR
jgi:lambda repressor-like predicted transcriptional regulator